MHPCVLSSFDLEPQPLQPVQFVCEIAKRNLECYVVNRGGSCVCCSIAGTLGAVEQGEPLSLTAVVAFHRVDSCSGMSAS